MNRIIAGLMIFIAAFASEAIAGMEVALKCDLSHVQGQLDGTDSIQVDILMSDGLAVWRGNLDSALKVGGGTMVGFATYERVTKLAASAGVNFKMPRNTGSGIAFSNTRGLYFVVLGWKNGQQIAAAIPVAFSPFGVGVGPPDDRWHSGGWFKFPMINDEDWVAWSNGG
ncbi:MAG: hypothetical protein HYT38_02045 [Candidatus Sungbacteria bacterium]|uniref:Uncharacterized protein n=1 Tax=Candidatus Sungiibacteriota bacterium TaxID=2750080 RepID=A0A931YDK9_9BACT|nr:hypothetical protein [Candidatus Sungbacteria bacterium]MBI2465983.1 hypothetical protein [Candidatus Sungbacteria bacterium]